MSKSRKFVIGGLAALLLTGPAAWADHHEGKEGDHGKKSRKFERRDADGNGVITQAEWLAAAEAKFLDLDADGDGSVTKEEWTAGRERMKKRWKEKRSER